MKAEYFTVHMGMAAPKTVYTVPAKCQPVQWVSGYNSGFMFDMQMEVASKPPKIMLSSGEALV